MFAKRLTVLSGLALLTLLPVNSASAQTCSAPDSKSTVNYNLHNPVSQILTNIFNNPATTESLGGEFFFEFHCETKANGDLHEHWTSHYNLTGTDSNGIKYIGKDQQNYDLKLDPDGTLPPMPTSDFRTSDKFKLKAITEVLEGKLVKRKVPLKALQFGPIQDAAGSTVRQEVTMQQGIPTEKAREIVKSIKETKKKVQASIQGDLVRVSGKDRDTLQEVMQHLRSQDFGIDMQFTNYRSV